MGVKVRLQCQQPLERGVRAVAFVSSRGDLFSANPLSRLFVQDCADDRNWGDLVLEEALLLSSGSPLLAEKRQFILLLAADLITFGNDFGSVTHDHVQARHALLHLGVWIVVPRSHANAFDPAAYRGIDALIDYLMSRNSNRLQSG